MKDFIKLDFNPRIARSQLRELRYLLDKNKSLSENDDIMPFFRDNHQLLVLIIPRLIDLIVWHLRSRKYRQ
ncbi:hypothetical protein MEO93_09655 [Dolichospermum sp. ST_sed3]|nr:hypothetical protein [Dolichospermum sp. ST_sed6]MDD1440621.1 hypothetical protein [Dolichospermum sp. ST_sed3]MDD1459398.1 hypothetical protein [Dolichospermum sp. ST_sed2]MDD1468945.1 hypothetical protein [Dolichospermum sp. ST_sed5]MDD1471923.1 hypothetical protein [Dolichospermum sp. ST_sed4]